MNFRQYKAHGIIVFVIATLFVTYGYMLSILPSLIVQPLMKQFHATATQIGFLSGFYFYAFFIAQFLVGPIIDNFRARIIMMLACTVCAISIYTFTISTTLIGGQISRLFIGLGGAFAFPMLNFLIQNWQRPQQFTMYSGIGVSVSTLSFAGCSIGFIALMKTLSWQAIGTNLTWAGVGIAIMALLFVSKKTTPVSIQKGTASQRKAFFHSIKMLLQLKEFWLLFVVVFLYFTTSAVVFALWGVNFLKQAQHLTESQASLTNACAFIGVGIGVVIFGIWASYSPRHKLFIVTSSTVSATILFIIIYVQFSFIGISILYFLLGFSIGPFICLYYLAKEIPEKNVVGTSLAIIEMASLLGAVIFQPLVGHILDLYWQGTMIDGARVFSAHAYGMAFLLVPCCQLAAAALAVFL